MKKLLTVLLTVLMVSSLVGCGKKEEAPEVVEVNPSEKTEGSMTYADFAAASTDYADVVVEGYITNFAYAKDYGNASFFMQDGDGGYFVYRMPCTDEDAAKLVVGQKVIIKGQKAAWKDEVEIAEGSATYTLAEGTYTFEAKDLTDAFANKDELYKSINMLIGFKGLEVASDPMYNWDGSGADGDDVYVTFKLGDASYSFLVESSEFGTGTEVYEAAKALKTGDVVNLEGFMYWYEGPQVHISAISK